MNTGQPHCEDAIHGSPIIALTDPVARLLDEYGFLSAVTKVLILPNHSTGRSHGFLSFVKRMVRTNQQPMSMSWSSKCALAYSFSQAKGLLIDWSVGPQLLGLIDKMPVLSWVHVIKTGVDHLPISALKCRGIMLTCVKGVYSRAVAEFVMGLVYCWAKRLLDHQGLRKKMDWQTIWSKELLGKKMLVLGTGEVGCAVAHLAVANGIQTFGVNKSGLHVCGFSQVVDVCKLMDVVQSADIVVNCLPLTSETKSLLGREFFKCMRKGSALINVGRDATIDHKALLEGLQQGQPVWAALDIDPPPKGHPYWRHPAIFLTQHCAYTSESARLALAHATMNNINLFLTGGELIGTVNLDKGY